jgi:hypothetical protein
MSAGAVVSREKCVGPAARPGVRPVPVRSYRAYRAGGALPSRAFTKR